MRHLRWRCCPHFEVPPPYQCLSYPLAAKVGDMSQCELGFIWTVYHYAQTNGAGRGSWRGQGSYLSHLSWKDTISFQTKGLWGRIVAILLGIGSQDCYSKRVSTPLRYSDVGEEHPLQDSPTCSPTMIVWTPTQPDDSWTVAVISCSRCVSGQSGFKQLFSTLWTSGSLEWSQLRDAVNLEDPGAWS